MEQGTQKAERIAARLTEDDKRLIQRGAALRGQKMSEFLVDSARKQAAEAVREHDIIVLTVRETIAFAEALENPPLPNDVLRTAAARYRAFTGKE